MKESDGLRKGKLSSSLYGKKGKKRKMGLIAMAEGEGEASSSMFLLPLSFFFFVAVLLSCFNLII